MYSSHVITDKSVDIKTPSKVTFEGEIILQTTDFGLINGGR